MSPWQAFPGQNNTQVFEEQGVATKLYSSWAGKMPTPTPITAAA